MDNYNIIKLIALIAVFISILLSFFLFSVKTKNKLANRLLAVFIILCAIDISGLFISQYLNLLIFSKTLTFLIFPSFFLYVLSISYSNFRIKYKHLFHAIAFILYSLVLVIFLFTDKNGLESYYFQKSEWIFIAILLKFQAFLYIIGIILTLKKHQRIYFENYTGGNINIYKWLYKITFVFILTFPITIAKEFLFLSNYHNIFTWTNIVLVSIALFMFCWFVLKALYNPELFRGIDSKLQTIKQLQKTYKFTEIIAQIQYLKKYMIEQKPYLDSKLTLQELAIQVNIDSRELSFLINQHIGQHFFDFVNEYRIKNAMEILQNSSMKELTIQQILYDVGFNSKSSFNTAFKKYTGHTPTEYRKLQ